MNGLFASLRIAGFGETKNFGFRQALLEVALVFFAASCFGAEPIQITTSQVNNWRTGANVKESILTPQNVNVWQFGKISSLSVDGNVYAEPLYVSQVNVPGKGILDLLFIVTEHNSVYAFEASGHSSEPVWHVQLRSTRSGESSPVRASDVQCPFISPEVGITATPVIDNKTGTMYVLARTRTQSNFLSGSEYSQQLHALAITTGHEKFGAPVEIKASVAGKGEGSSGGEIRFDALRENPRAGLLLTTVRFT